MHKTAILLAAALGLSACAPDQFSNVKATGLNGFIDHVSVVCAPLQVGPMVITPNFQPPNYATAQYGVWLDQVSNQYYKRIEPAVFTQNIKRMFPGERSAKANQCLVENLPPPSERSS